MEDSQINRPKHIKKIILTAVLSCPPVLMIITWITLRELPSSVACVFRDNWYLRVIWPFNATIYAQFRTVNYPATDQCLLVAGNSLFSAYFAILFILGISAGIRTFFKDREIFNLKPEVDLPLWKIGLTLAFLLALTWLSSYFSDGEHGRYSQLAYRTYNSPGVLVSKTILFMFVDYVLLFLWAVGVIKEIGTPRAGE